MLFVRNRALSKKITLKCSKSKSLMDNRKWRKYIKPRNYNSKNSSKRWQKRKLNSKYWRAKKHPFFRFRKSIGIWMKIINKITQILLLRNRRSLEKEDPKSRKPKVNKKKGGHKMRKGQERKLYQKIPKRSLSFKMMEMNQNKFKVKLCKAVHLISYKINRRRSESWMKKALQTIKRFWDRLYFRVVKAKIWKFKNNTKQMNRIRKA